ncbi:hypothetical protein [Nocardiopsis suaedae]|uniref:Uncharacterized protein n=1 Tax=Nocardiopsis suaedae TaxID=3018444 RepID=A0ABT4TS74_9ACTN|nr:hypothetical protein [Nocardiopsis suaedae]MDA2807246.1 hypothetical protein [Nocardiopsis suaedae]
MRAELFADLIRRLGEFFEKYSDEIAGFLEEAAARQAQATAELEAEGGAARDCQPSGACARRASVESAEEGQLCACASAEIRAALT